MRGVWLDYASSLRGRKESAGAGTRWGTQGVTWWPEREGGRKDEEHDGRGWSGALDRAGTVLWDPHWRETPFPSGGLERYG